MLLFNHILFQTKRRSASVHGASNLRRTGASARSRSKSPLSGPWVPPPGKSTKASSLYSWQVGGGVGWGGVGWGGVGWVGWGGVGWGGVGWGGVGWGGWGGVGWGGVGGVGWGGVGWDGMGWDGMGWDGMGGISHSRPQELVNTQLEPM